MIKGQARQKGMTLLELLVGMAITTMIMSGSLALIYHEVTSTATGKTSVTAAHNISNAARWLSQDVMMAESTGLVEGTDPVNHLALTWIERYDFANIPHSSNYSLCGTELRRDYDGTLTTVARDISKIEFSQNGSVITVSISCTPQWRVANPTVEKTYRIYLRAADEG